MIPKADATDGTNNTLSWGKNLHGLDVPNLENLSLDTEKKADYNGKANTAAIIAGYTTLGIDMVNRDMCKVLETYNEGGYTDWYIPACGQLYEIYTNVTDINTALTNIGGTAFISKEYWSSSESSSSFGGGVHFGEGEVYGYGKASVRQVRFIRDI